ncbi:MAG: hypothetical protein KTR15_15720 [Phycisphaeraceae bacterium]|nr:hypothetical protein [Phycisphaeraceae bacterium]
MVHITNHKGDSLLCVFYANNCWIALINLRPPLHAMGYRSGLEIKRAILNHLGQRPYVLSELQRGVATNDRVLRRHLDELAYLGLVTLITHPRHERTGRPYTTARLGFGFSTHFDGNGSIPAPYLAFDPTVVPEDSLAGQVLDDEDKRIP